MSIVRIEPLGEFSMVKYPTEWTCAIVAIPLGA